MLASPLRGWTRNCGILRGSSSEQSLAGRVLHVLIGYRDRPTLGEGLAYVATVWQHFPAVEAPVGVQAAGTDLKFAARQSRR